MNVFLLHDPRIFDQCARFSHVGTWTSGKICKKCGRSTSRLVEPLQIEWEPDSDLVCDFSWCGYVAAVKDSVGRYLLEEGFEFRLGTVEYVPTKTKSKRRIVSHPYEGPGLSWMIPLKEISLNEEKSGVQLKMKCDECGQSKYRFQTQEIVIDRISWSGEKLFCIEQFSRSGAMFITEESVAILERREVNNIAYSEAGVIS